MSRAEEIVTAWERARGPLPSSIFDIAWAKGYETRDARAALSLLGKRGAQKKADRKQRKAPLPASQASRQRSVSADTQLLLFET